SGDAEEGPLLRRRTPHAAERPSALDGLLLRLAKRQKDMGETSPPRDANQSDSSEEYVRLRNARDGWRASVRLLWQRRPVLPRHGRQGSVVAKMERFQDST